MATGSGFRPDSRHRGRAPKKAGGKRRGSDRAHIHRSPDRVAQAQPKPFEGTILFLPRQSVFENVVAQIKSGSVAYSLFVLARLFLEKPGRYEVRLGRAVAGNPFGFELAARRYLVIVSEDRQTMPEPEPDGEVTYLAAAMPSASRTPGVRTT